MSTATSTQTRYPWRAAVRTFVQVWLPLLVVIVLGLPELIAIIDAEAGEHLPPQLRAWLLGLSTLASVLAAVGARVMALPWVGQLLDATRGLGWLSPEPPGRHSEDVVRRLSGGRG